MKFLSIIFVFVFCLYASRIECARFQHPRLRYYPIEDNRFKIEEHTINTQQLEMLNNDSGELKKTLDAIRFNQESFDKANDLSQKNANSIYGSSGASDAQNVELEHELEASKTQREHLRKTFPNTYNNLRFYVGYNVAAKNGNKADFLMHWRQDQKLDQLEALKRQTEKQ